MNILYWDIENIRTIDSSKFPNVQFDIVQCCFAFPFTDVDRRISLSYDKLNIHKMNSRGPDLADFHLLSVLNSDIMDEGRDHNFYLATHDKLLSYRFIVLARNCSVYRENIHTLLPEIDIRRRSKKGYSLFEEGDMDKIPT